MSMEAQSRTDVGDELLVQRFVETHDADCFGQLFLLYRKRIYFACRVFFENGSMAEDATQETFLRAYQNMHRFCGGNFCAWLMRIAKNVCIDQWRKQRPEVAAEESEMEIVADGRSLDNRVDLGIAVDKVRSEMQTLTAEQRFCLEMAIEGYSYEETAIRAGLSVKAVKSHIQNGRRMLWLKMQNMLSQLR